MAAISPTAATHRAPLVHPAWLRVTHWINALALLILVTSGWRIYNASPIFDFRFPKAITLGGWLGGALQWHFAAMWLLVANGLVYLAFNLLTGRLHRKLLPIRPRDVVDDLRAALRGALSLEHGSYHRISCFWFGDL